MYDTIHAISKSFPAEPRSTTFVTKHPWVKRMPVQDASSLFKLMATLFSNGRYSKIAKVHFKSFYSRTMGLISSKLGTKKPWIKGIQICSNEGPLTISMKMMSTAFLIVTLLKFAYYWEMFLR